MDKSSEKPKRIGRPSYYDYPDFLTISLRRRRTEASRLVKKRSEKVGLPPGTLVHIGEKKTEKVKITAIDYSETEFQEFETTTVDECIPLKDKPTITWINVDGIHQSDVIQKLGDCYGLHPLVLEDVMNTDQRPKIEDYGDYIYIVLKKISYDEQKVEISLEQVSLILGKNFVISFQEKGNGRDALETIRERIRNAKGRIRKMGADYLAYALIDAIVDHYFLIFEKLGEKIESIEDELIEEATAGAISVANALRKEVMFLRRQIWPLMDALRAIERGEFSLISGQTKVYFRDVYDHVAYLIDTIETYRETLAYMGEIYLESVNNKLNQIMKVLAVVATIFMPLTLIASIYGMNFEFMPELHWRWGYPAVLAVMVIIGIVMVVYFKKRKWI